MEGTQLTLNLNCNHYFIYDTPDGTYSKGHCKYCGKEDKALNVMPHMIPPKHLTRHGVNLNMLGSTNGGFYL